MCIISYMCVVYDVGYMSEKKDKKRVKERKRRKERDEMGVHDVLCV